MHTHSHTDGSFPASQQRRQPFLTRSHVEFSVFGKDALTHGKPNLSSSNQSFPWWPHSLTLVSVAQVLLLLCKYICRGYNPRITGVVWKRRAYFSGGNSCVLPNAGFLVLLEYSIRSENISPLLPDYDLFEMLFFYFLELYIKVAQSSKYCMETYNEFRNCNIFLPSLVWQQHSWKAPKITYMQQPCLVHTGISSDPPITWTVCWPTLFTQLWSVTCW